MTDSRLTKWRDYVPLAVIFALTLLAASAKQADYGAWVWMRWMGDFMGFFLVVFSMFKFFDLSGFADGFQKYDLLAGPFRPYAYLYPFIELALDSPTWRTGGRRRFIPPPSSSCRGGRRESSARLPGDWTSDARAWARSSRCRYPRSRSLKTSGWRSWPAVC